MSELLRRASAHWSAFWFTPGRPEALGMARLAFYGFLFYHLHDLDTAGWLPVADLYWEPLPIVRALGLRLASAEVLHALDLTFAASLALACVGLLTRPATAIAALTGAYLLAMPHNMGKVHHSSAVLLFLLAAMAVSRCGDAWSVDAWLRARRAPDGPRPGPGPEYTWPLRFGWLMVCLVYFAAGCAKVHKSGLEWITSDGVQNLMLMHPFTHDPPTGLALWAAAVPGLHHVLAGGALALELGAPLALLSRRLRPVIALALATMQLGIWLAMGVFFNAFFAAFLFFGPWEWLARRLPAGGTGADGG